MRFPTLKDGSRNWCATCIHNYGDHCEFGERCMYQSNSVGIYNRDLPPTEYEEDEHGRTEKLRELQT